MGTAGTSLRAYYTLTDSKDHASDEQLLRRPRQSGGIVNVAANWKVTPNIQLFGRIDNLLNAEYEEILGYGTMGITGYIGVKIGNSGY